MRWLWTSTLALGLLFCAQHASAQRRIIELSITPTERAQIAIWLEHEGTFVRTLALTEATALRGIGNRPGAMQMNSGFHWPYGRREGVLPIWAHRRVTVQDPFRRVIFQERHEGYASREVPDASPDDYFCLSFNREASGREALDAVSCASVFNSDKGRYITPSDLSAAYAEPFNTSPTQQTMRALSLDSLYPPRRDHPSQIGQDHPDVELFRMDALSAMPEIDAVTMATLAGDRLRTLRFEMPRELEEGDYSLFIEVAVEGDYNATFGPESYPTPVGEEWDSWAESFGYPYRGQPSVVYEIPFAFRATGSLTEISEPVGYSGVHGESGEMRAMSDALITDDPGAFPGSGADRLRMEQGRRAQLRVIPWAVCAVADPPPECMQACTSHAGCADNFICDEASGMCRGLCDIELHPAPPTELTITLDEERSWNYAHVQFRVADSARAIAEYQVRVSTSPFEEGMAFESWGTQAKAAVLEDVVAMVPVGQSVGDLVDVSIGHLAPETEYYVGLRAIDACGGGSEVALGTVTTTEIIFTTVSPCFVATATYESPMAGEVRTLRRFRDRHLRNHALGRALVDLYYEWGPSAAAFIRHDESRRAASRTLLGPAIWLVEHLFR